MSLDVIEDYIYIRKIRMKVNIYIINELCLQGVILVCVDVDVRDIQCVSMYIYLVFQFC